MFSSGPLEPDSRQRSLSRLPFRPVGVACPLLLSPMSRGRLDGLCENHFDRSGRMLETRDRTFLMIELLGSSSRLALSALVFNGAAAAVAAAIGDGCDGLPSLVLLVLERV